MPLVASGQQIPGSWVINEANKVDLSAWNNWALVYPGQAFEDSRIRAILKLLDEWDYDGDGTKPVVAGEIVVYNPVMSWYRNTFEGLGGFYLCLYIPEGAAPGVMSTDWQLWGFDG